MNIGSGQRVFGRRGRFSRPAASAFVAVLLGGFLPVVQFAPPAQAAAVGTVMARTQRMSDANLQSRQDGWYDKGQKLTLLCSKRGQAVKGYFSFNIPNGGWDNLWYKVSDNMFVADVDIETGTLNAVVDDCGKVGTPQGTNPPAAQASREDRAIAWANGKVGSSDYVFSCGRFVANAYGKSTLGVGSALIFHDNLAKAGQIHMDYNFPKGALVFSLSKFDIYKGVHQGHVVIARGDGKFVSGGAEGVPPANTSVQVLNSWNPAGGAQYLGWAYAPADWPGV